ncbi:hypothetical protein G7046_g8830 [Stylonectria norvegica]|nr:hypothetical protein G7046_g8830 [Stylonectria norvegica]
MPSLRSLVAVATIALIQATQAHHIELPSCLNPFQPYVYSGCFADPGTPSALVYRSGQDTSAMTVEKCVAECKGNGFRYAGLKYWGVCYCGATVRGAQLDESQCTYPCTGNNSETCGGDNQLSVWSDPTFKAGSVSIGSFKSLGCYTDTSSKGRALSWSVSDWATTNFDGSTMTPQNCLQACDDNGYPMAGTEYGGECWCSQVIANDTIAVDPSQCNVPCNGDNSQMCGGAGRLNLYVSTDLLSLKPCVALNIPTYVGIPTSSIGVIGGIGGMSSSSASSSSTAAAAANNGGSPGGNGGNGGNAASSSSTTSAAANGGGIGGIGGNGGNAASSSTTAAAANGGGNGGNGANGAASSSSTTAPAANGGGNGGIGGNGANSVSTTSTIGYPAPPAGGGKLVVTTSSTTTTTPVPAKPSTTSTTSAQTSSSATVPAGGLCTNTVVLPSDCEYKCGNWCAPSLPDFQDATTCQTAYKTCAKLVSSCFQNAGWPAALNCFDFNSWCSGVQTYCTGSCQGKKCSKASCVKNNAPSGTAAPSSTTTVVPCVATTSTIPAVSQTSVVPVPTNICVQPSSDRFNYGPGNPVAGIEMPLVSCNDIKNDFASKPFKLYSATSSSQCGSYSRAQSNSACADACKVQYTNCQAVYVQSCKSLNSRSYFARRALEAQGIEKRWFNRWSGDSWQSASSKCTIQYADCLGENWNVNAQNRCQNWGTGA